MRKGKMNMDDDAVAVTDQMSILHSTVMFISHFMIVCFLIDYKIRFLISKYSIEKKESECSVKEREQNYPKMWKQRLPVHL